MRAEDLVVEAVEAAQLRDRPLVVVDAQVDDDVRELRVARVLLDDEQRSRLLPAPVAPGGLCRREALEQALREREVARSLERDGERVDRRAPRRGCFPAPRSSAPCARPAQSWHSSPVKVAARPCPSTIADLPLGAAVVGGRQRVDRLLRRPALPQEREPSGP